MDDVQRKRILDLYGCKENITSYLVHSGTKIGTTNKSKLKVGLSVENLEDE